MVKEKMDICPKCGGELQTRGYIQRMIRYKNGEKLFVKLRRYSCKKCRSWHREVPDWLVPYKHYP